MLYMATEALKKASKGIILITASNAILKPRGGEIGNNAILTIVITITLIDGPNIIVSPSNQTLLANLGPDLVIRYTVSNPNIIAAMAIKLYMGPAASEPGNITNKLIKFIVATAKLTRAPYK